MTLRFITSVFELLGSRILRRPGILFAASAQGRNRVRLRRNVVGERGTATSARSRRVEHLLKREVEAALPRRPAAAQLVVDPADSCRCRPSTYRPPTARTFSPSTFVSSAERGAASNSGVADPRPSFMHSPGQERLGVAAEEDVDGDVRHDRHRLQDAPPCRASRPPAGGHFGVEEDLVHAPRFCSVAPRAARTFSTEIVASVL